MRLIPQRTCFIGEPTKWPGCGASLHQKYGFDLSSVVIHATHNHSGPQTSDWFAPSLGIFEPEYGGLLERALFQGVEAAWDCREIVSVERGFGQCGFAISRRKPSGSQILMAPNAEGPLDREVSVIRFAARSGATKALLVHYAVIPQQATKTAFPPSSPAKPWNTWRPSQAAKRSQPTCRAAAAMSGLLWYETGGSIEGATKKFANWDSNWLMRCALDSPSPVGLLLLCPLKGNTLQVHLPVQSLPSKAELDAGKWKPRG